MKLNLVKTARTAIDVFLLGVAFYLAFLFRFEFDIPPLFARRMLFSLPFVLLLQIGTLHLFRIHRLAWRYISLKDIPRIAAAAGCASAVLVALRLGTVGIGGYLQYAKIPLGVLAMNFLMTFLFITGARALHRTWTEREERRRRRGTVGAPAATLFIGAGRAGVSAAKEVLQNPGIGMKIIGFLDDNPAKVGTSILGIPVLGTTAAIKTLVADRKVMQAIITIASVRGTDIRRIVAMCKEVDLPVKIIPSINEILEGRVNLSRIRNVSIEDLLGRETVNLDTAAIGTFLSEKRVLVTGAGGSIGSELCRQVAAYGPRKLILLEQAENPLFEIHKQLLRAFPNLPLTPCIADVADAARLDAVFASEMPQVVFHAAAHKHVPMMEWNPGEAVKNNILGTKYTADAADRFGAESFVLISTDKAVNPTSVMGATKRVAELYMQAIAERSKTKFVAVRFGNVLGSAGSVIPVFNEQIRNGGPVTVTHPEMKRYFMTIPEACRLVLQASVIGHGGEIMVLDMGEPVRIVDLARDLIRLSGFSEEEIPIVYTGPRPGEKLFEELSTTGEFMAKTRHPKIFIGKIESCNEQKILKEIDRLTPVIETAGREDIRAALRTLVPEIAEAAPEGPETLLG